MKLDTERLSLISLSIKHLTRDLPAFLEILNYPFPPGLVENEKFLEMIEKHFEKTNDERKCPYHTIWFLTRKTDRALVGCAAFRNVDNKNEENEISYQLMNDFQQNGYMTEAVKALCAWAQEQEGVSRLIAETKPDNLASQNILKECGFSLYKQEDTLWWRL